MPGPSQRWNNQHRGQKNRGQNRDKRKIVHSTIWGARWHQLRIWWKFGDRLQAYECRWGDDYHDGETAPRHYHVGRVYHSRED